MPVERGAGARPRGRMKRLALCGAPSRRQRAFLQAGQKYVAYGGARGGGKSWALRRKCVLLAMRYAGIRILLLRRTLQELRENHTLPLRAELGETVPYVTAEKAFCFPNGSRLKLGYCENDGDVTQYQGQEYDIIGMDEGTQFTEYQFFCLTACLRGGVPGHPKRFYITCNPGGVGHAWVKRLFIDRQYRPGERAEDYAFVPARVYDNDFLMQTNPDYLRQLQNLPDGLRQAWLEGEWDAFAGQFFPEFSRGMHVCAPFDIPAAWPRYYAQDYGLDMLAGLWAAVSPAGEAYVYREIYQSGLVVSEAAAAIRALEAEGETLVCRVAPPDLWGRTKDSGLSVIELFGQGGLYFARAQSGRAQGWMALREWLRPFEKDGRRTARLHIFETCANLIRTLPLLQYDKRNSADAATEPHEPTHAPDALRYLTSFVRAQPRGEARRAVPPPAASLLQGW